MLKEPDQDQVLTGSPPFTRRENKELACKIVLEGERPLRPTDSGKLGLTDEVWGTLQRCWEKEPSARPSIDEVSAYLRLATENWVVDVPAFMLASKAGIEQVVSSKGEQARDFADRLDEVRSCEICSYPLIGVLISIFIPEPRPDRYQSALGEGIPEPSPEAMQRIRCFTSLTYACREVR